MVDPEGYPALDTSVQSNNLSDCCPSRLSSRASLIPAGSRISFQDSEFWSRDKTSQLAASSSLALSSAESTTRATRTSSCEYEPVLIMDSSVIRWYVRGFAQRRRPGTSSKSMLLVANLSAIFEATP